MNYRETRNYLNLEKRIYETANPYGFPELRPCNLELDSAQMLGFNYAKTEKHPEDKIVHFFLDDYQFERVWNNPNHYISLLSRFKAVVMPDFSTYSDFPMIIQQYNHYRNLWLARYWQDYGVEVIPQSYFAADGSIDWAYIGMPKYSLLCISTVGGILRKEAKANFPTGLKRTLDILQPREILLYGKMYPILEEAIKESSFTGKITVGRPQNFADLEAKSMRGKETA